MLSFRFFATGVQHILLTRHVVEEHTEMQNRRYGSVKAYLRYHDSSPVCAK